MAKRFIPFDLKETNTELSSEVALPHRESVQPEPNSGAFKYDSDTNPEKWGFIWGSDSPRVGEKAAKRILGDLVNTEQSFPDLVGGLVWLHITRRYQVGMGWGLSPSLSTIQLSNPVIGLSNTRNLCHLHLQLSTLEVSRYDISKPWLLDYLIITCLWFDQSAYIKVTTEEATKVSAAMAS
ncbi:hypothetical protein DL96DRAFT_1558168 [Flagelloscypha sp. PMI_526]|nr:hypothetical protein DL96DRAFT_1558168 [Flagelloscypha sp. PMI_526]